MLARKLEQGAAAAEQERQQAQEAPRAPRASTRREKGMVEQIVASPMLKQIAGTATREIFRGLFGTARRR